MLFYIVFAKLTNFAKFENNRQSYWRLELTRFS